MKKIISFAFLIVAITVVHTSCSQSESIQQKLKNESKAIDRFISKNGFQIIDTYPENGVFKENQYFKTSDGLYIHVIDSGNGNRAKLNQTVLARFTGRYTINGEDTTKWNTGRNPDEFIFGRSSSYSTSSSPNSCDGLVIPLLYVGENAKVSLIIPSKLGSTYGGTYSDQQQILAIHYETITYSFY